MKLSVDKEKKFVFLWLTQEEASDVQLADELKAIMAQFRQKKYKVIVCRSGKRDLTEMTEMLLEHNVNLG